jgi:outer membrane protein assembly factor BamB
LVYDWRSGEQLYDLTPNDLPPVAQFGISVAADENFVFVGANNDPVSQQGKAYVFDLSTGERLRRIDAPTGEWPNFGNSIAVRNGVVFVGAFRQTVYLPLDASGETVRDSNHGAVYAFSVESGKEIARFTVPRMSAGGREYYGFSIDFDGNQLIAGTTGWPKHAYLTDFRVAEPRTVTVLSITTVMGLALRECRRRKSLIAVIFHSGTASERIRSSR